MVALLTTTDGAPARPATPPAPSIAWRDAGALVLREAETHLGQGNFTGYRGPWCGWFVDAVLRAAGRRPLGSGLASAALSYGPHVARPTPGDLVVMRGHVGFVVADLGGEIIIVSGNWSRRVARARIPRRAALAFVRVG